MGIRKKVKCRILSANFSQLRLLSMFKEEVYLLNLGPGGACIAFRISQCTAAVQLGSLIEITLPLDDGELLVLTGRVVWLKRAAKEIQAGLSFDIILENDRLKLLNYLREEIKYTRLES